MSSSNSYQSFSETKQDYRISWQLLRENWKAFISTILFAGFFLLIVSIGLFIGAHFVPNFFFDFTRDLSNLINRLFFFLTRFSVIIIAIVVFFAFLSCQYGLAYDTMSSGDMFAEFKGSFTYFKRHWWQYSILTILISWGFFLIQGNGPLSPHPGLTLLNLFIPAPHTQLRYYIMRVITAIIFFIIFMLVINTLPSVTAQGNEKASSFEKFKNSFTESYKIFRKYPKRLLKTWGIFFLIFYIPLNLSIIFSNITYNPFLPTFTMQILRILTSFSWLSLIFIGTPLMALIATRIYNSVEIS